MSFLVYRRYNDGGRFSKAEASWLIEIWIESIQRTRKLEKVLYCNKIGIDLNLNCRVGLNFSLSSFRSTLQKLNTYLIDILYEDILSG